MKGFVVAFILLFVAGMMGGSLYWVLRKAPEFQALSAEKMKEAFLNQGPVEVTDSTGTTWIFPSEPHLWTFKVEGPLLKIQAPLPQNTGISPSVETSSLREPLRREVFRRLSLKEDPESPTQVEIELFEVK